MDLEVTLGSFTVFLSPRQVHILMELRRGLASPDMEDVSNVPPRPCTEKPMANSDFNRVERELLHQIHPSHGLRTMVNKKRDIFHSSSYTKYSEQFLLNIIK